MIYRPLQFYPTSKTAFLAKWQNQHSMDHFFYTWLLSSVRNPQILYFYHKLLRITELHHTLIWDFCFIFYLSQTTAILTSSKHYQHVLILLFRRMLRPRLIWYCIDLFGKLLRLPAGTITTIPKPSSKLTSLSWNRQRLGKRLFLPLMFIMIIEISFASFLRRLGPKTKEASVNFYLFRSIAFR